MGKKGRVGGEGVPGVIAYCRCQSGLLCAPSIIR